MAHHVKFSVPKRELGIVDIEFEVYSTDTEELFGTLGVSKGGVEWQPGKGKKAYFLDWSRLNDMAQEKGRRKDPGTR